MASFSPEIHHHLRLFFRDTNLYQVRPPPPGITKREFRASGERYWNLRAEALISLGLAVRREIEDKIFLSPTWQALEILAEIESPSRAGCTSFREIRVSMVQADNETRKVIERIWRASFEDEGKVFPLGWGFAYLLDKP